MATVAEVHDVAEAGPRPFDLMTDVFFQMIELGLIPTKSRVYLWNGRIYEAMAKIVPHAVFSVMIHQALNRRLPSGRLLWPENPIRLNERSAPMPDIAVVRGEPYDYLRASRHPGAADIGMLIEISVTSLPKDLGEKREQYAQAFVPVYWVADVLGRRILVHTEPGIEDGRGRYGRVEPFGPGQSIPLVLDGRELDRIPYEEFLR
ncbi:MAG: Uma2 family endonuclease [Isosphaeraceae bacterium]